MRPNRINPGPGPGSFSIVNPTYNKNSTARGPTGSVQYDLDNDAPQSGSTTEYYFGVLESQGETFVDPESEAYFSKVLAGDY